MQLTEPADKERKKEAIKVECGLLAYIDTPSLK